MMIGSIADAELLTTIHTVLPEIYCSEIVSVNPDDGDRIFAQSMLELMIDEPLKFSRGKEHVHVVICLTEYLSAIAFKDLKYIKQADKLRSTF